jgi:endonuclease YncB( thermonuclease family)
MPLGAVLALAMLALPPGAPVVAVEDDYARALELARERGQPIFVDAWAPW